jgi:hypothetical protein
MFKMKMDIDRHGPRPMPNNCKNLNPPNFSLPTTFKAKIIRFICTYVDEIYKYVPQFSEWYVDFAVEKDQDQKRQ